MAKKKLKKAVLEARRAHIAYDQQFKHQKQHEQQRRQEPEQKQGT
jgi:hypothetical protein